MISRRVALASGAAVLLAGAVSFLRGGWTDDALQALGARPKPLPDQSDAKLIQVAASQLGSAVSALEGLGAEVDDLRELAVEQLAGLGQADPGQSAGGSATMGDVATIFSDQSQLRAADSVAANSRDLAVVFASMSAGQAQLARELRSRS